MPNFGKITNMVVWNTETSSGICIGGNYAQN